MRAGEQTLSFVGGLYRGGTFVYICYLRWRVIERMAVDIPPPLDPFVGAGALVRHNDLTSLNTPEQPNVLYAILHGAYFGSFSHCGHVVLLHTSVLDTVLSRVFI